MFKFLDTFIASARVMHGKILRAKRASETHEIQNSAFLAAVDAVLQRVTLTKRKSFEWGVCDVKALFGRFEMLLSADASIRFRLLQVSIHLYNRRTRKMALNQVQTVYRDKNISLQPWSKRLAKM